MTYSVNGGGVGREGAREGSEVQSQKEKDSERGSGTGDRAQGPLAPEGGLYLDILQRPPSF